MTSTTRRAGLQKIRNQALHADTASPGLQITHPQPPRLNSYNWSFCKPVLRGDPSDASRKYSAIGGGCRLGAGLRFVIELIRYAGPARIVALG